MDCFRHLRSLVIFVYLRNSLSTYIFPVPRAEKRGYITARSNRLDVARAANRKHSHHIIGHSISFSYRDYF